MIALWEKQIVPAFPDYDFREGYHTDCIQGYRLTSERPGVEDSAPFQVLSHPGSQARCSPALPQYPEDEHWEQG